MLSNEKMNFQKDQYLQILYWQTIKRGSPKSQSAFLEAMEEKKVSIDGESYNLPEPFFVIATQIQWTHQEQVLYLNLN